LPSGRIDPTGLVKGWSVERAGEILRAAGSVNHAVNGGGDMQLAGEPAPGRPWAVGITDPRDGSRVLATVSRRDGAVATSGTSERGRHIVDPFTGRAAASGLLSATVVGPRLTEVDAYATAAFVMGTAALRWIDSLAGYEALLVTGDGAALHTTGWSTQP
jgi:thiamine biosynthesis lipoprotein